MMADPEDASVQRAHAADMTPTPAPDDAVAGDAGQASAPALREQFTRSIIRSKVQPPPVRDSTLERPRLLEWLTDRTSDRLVVITAEAGYGKTTLLADFARRAPVTCLWVRLDATDGDWITFTNYLLAAIREAQPEFGTQTASLLSQIATANVTMPAVLDSLISELPMLNLGPTLLILDDFHLVDDSKDVHTILARLLEFAPDNASVLISGRTPPSVRAGRLTAHGRASRLSTDDLRFSADETADLFATAYQLPLESDLVTEIDARAEGWAASLQLVYSSIRERHPSDARAFIRSLSGASGDLYDYLAEEVLTGLTDQLRRVLTRASILEWIVPEYVLAILSSEPDAPTPDQLNELLDEADHRGLLGRTAVGASVKRFHPLLRTYLEHELNLSTSVEARQQMHLRVAQAADGDDWLTAADHYISADYPAEAMRVIAESATAALGNGDFGNLTRLLARMPDIQPPLAVQALRARSILASDGERAAAALLDSLDLTLATDYEQALVAFARTCTYWVAGDLSKWRKATAEVLSQSSAVPDSLLELITAWTALADVGESRTLAEIQKSLAALADQQAQRGHHYHAAISFHNAMTYALARGEFENALQFGDQAVSAYHSVTGSPREYASTLATMAIALFETGAVDRAIAMANLVTTIRSAHPDAYADSAYVQALVGQTAAASATLNLALHALAQGQVDMSARYSVANSQAFIAIALGRPEEAIMVLADPPDFPDPEVGVRRALNLTLAHIALDDGIAADQLAKAREIMWRSGAERYQARIDVLERVIAGDWHAVAQLLQQPRQPIDMVLLDLAEALIYGLGPAEHFPGPIARSITDHPDRWLPVARRLITRGQHPIARASARLLAEFGGSDDLPRVAAYERTYIPKTDRSRSLARRLISRSGPRLAVHDLGRIRFQLSGRSMSGSHTRRKAASLLAFLITCPNQTATKEQVVDALWSELDAAAGMNSLNQTLYFLRRDIDQWHQPPTSPEYVVNESELVWLDKELVTVDSVEFYANAREIQTAQWTDRGLELCRSYAGRFAPEFEYEEWSMGWRDRLHASYLSAVHWAVAALTERGRLLDARSLLLVASSVDPDAMDLDPALIWIYDRLGSRAAAIEQYRRFGAATRLVLAEEPPSLEKILSSEGPSGLMPRP